MPGLRIDLDVANVRRKGRPRPLGVDRHLGADRPPGPRRLDRDFGQWQRIEAPRIGSGRIGAAVSPIDRLGTDVPNHCGALLQLIDDLFGCLHGRHAGREGDAAAAGHMREPDRGGVGDDRFHPLDRNAESLRSHHCH